MRRVVQILAAVVFLAGLVLFLGPQVNGWLGQRNSDSAIDTFEAELPAGEASSGEEDSGKAADGDTSEDSEEGESGADSADQYFEEVSAESLAALRSELEAYNQQLYESGQSGLRDPFDYENSSFDLTRYGFSQNVIGVLWIPRMQEKLPVYLGANHDNMAKGAGLMGQTSMPLGEKILMWLLRLTEDGRGSPCSGISSHFRLETRSRSQRPGIRLSTGCAILRSYRRRIRKKY